MNRLIREILDSEIFEARPPVLFDVGASSELIEQWREIGRWSIVVAFDPDDRLTGYLEKRDSRYRRLCFLPRVVYHEPVEECEFFLTASPECSSCLEPDQEGIAGWNHAGFFDICSHTRCRCVTVAAALETLELDRIDGFKIDAQGTDLRIFRSIPEAVRKNTFAVELEPGIMNAYVGEDKLHSVLRFMEEDGGFWLCDCRIQSAWRLNPELRRKYLSRLQARLVPTCWPGAPGWSETSFLTTLTKCDATERNFQLAWIFAMLYRQYGFALEIADRGVEIFGSPLYERMISATVHDAPMVLPVARKLWRKAVNFCRPKRK